MRGLAFKYNKEACQNKIPILLKLRNYQQKQLKGRSQPVFAGKPWDHFICPVASFFEIREEKKKMKKGLRTEKLVL